MWVLPILVIVLAIVVVQITDLTVHIGYFNLSTADTGYWFVIMIDEWYLYCDYSKQSFL